jgi:toxin ParE1/3/4
MAEVRLSPRASADLDDIAAYGLARHGKDSAAAYFQSFHKVFALLEDHPLSGQIDEDTGFRRWHHRSHRIFYRVDEAEVLIVRIVHQSRDVGRVEFEG